jgi:hypothetical protein
MSLNGINQLIFVMVKCGVLFDIRTEFLNSIQTNFDFKVLHTVCLLLIAFKTNISRAVAIFNFNVLIFLEVCYHTRK